MITHIQVDPHAGSRGGKIILGNVKKGVEVYLAPVQKERCSKSRFIWPRPVLVDDVPPGNIVALVGLQGVCW